MLCSRSCTITWKAVPLGPGPWPQRSSLFGMSSGVDFEVLPGSLSTLVCRWSAENKVDMFRNETDDSWPLAVPESVETFVSDVPRRVLQLCPQLRPDPQRSQGLRMIFCLMQRDKSDNHKKQQPIHIYKATSHQHDELVVV